VPQDGYLNLIHVDDVVRVVLAAEQRAQPPAIYAVSDGRPMTRRDFYREAACCLNVPAPHFQEPDPGSPLALRASSSKRVRNTRMLNDLAVRLQYPSYREGLAAIVADESPA
jgi:nucleoside-diphosphate-sugar epimerase